MAQAKKPATKKPVAKKPAAKKTVRAPKATRPTAVAAETHLQSFKLSSDSNFFAFRFTQQTLYWAIIAVLVIALAAWVLYLQVQINAIYDAIEINNAM